MTRRGETVLIQLTVNGRPRVLEASPQQSLLGLLRDALGLTGTKSCCLVGECGACTVSLDGRIVDSCLVLAGEADGADVVTIEGLAANDAPTPLQRAFLEKGAAQCGYCTPGQVMAARDLLERTPHPTAGQVQEGMSGNLCRCGCYYQITDAVLAAAAASDR
ncbi:MAG: (2Fe-2S)-binding protein [Candidatus Dormibacteria bacterium]